MSDTRTVVRFLAFLVLAVLVGMGFLLKRMASNGAQLGGIGRYQNRASNEEAWKAFDSLQQPPYQRVLSYACAWTPPGMDCGKTLLPSDELRHVLLTFRSPERRKEAMVDDPVKLWAKSLEMEWDVPLSGKITPQSTLADVLVAWNQLSKELQQKKTADSLARTQPAPTGASEPPPAPVPPVDTLPVPNPINL